MQSVMCKVLIAVMIVAGGAAYGWMLELWSLD
jgi:hypothetical protein